MGYLSYYQLGIEQSPEGCDDEAVIEEVLAIIKERFHEDLKEQTKWYSSDDDMLKLSKDYPEITFCINREGEEPDDLGYTYYRNGKMQECAAVISYDNFDETKLK